MSTNGSLKLGDNVSKYNIHFDTGSIVNSPGYQSMVASLNAATKFSEQHAAMVATAEKQIEPARQMLKLAATANADPMLKAFESTFKLAEGQTRLLVNLKGIQDAIKAASPESLGMPPGWHDILATVSKPTFDPSFTETLVAQTDELEEEVQAVHAEQSVQDFFESQPELTEEIQALPAVRAVPNEADRKKIVRFVQVGVFFFATAVLQNVAEANPELGAGIGATGIGGLTVAAAAGRPVRKIIDKMADDEDFTGEIKEPLWED